jgi:hypothetical protein
MFRVYHIDGKLLAKHIKRVRLKLLFSNDYQRGEAELKVLVEDGRYCLKKPSVQGQKTREVQGRTMAFESNTAHLKKSTFNHTHIKIVPLLYKGYL